ncbi:MAG TPA: DUF4397 domain-containing protein [Streptosporangiaceae bacterium]|nr:DUF4397 domain-containing protein [Streptosporangiaceae bacterium]
MKGHLTGRRIALLLAVPALCLSVSATAASASASSGGGANADAGWIRLAHLSPNTPAVDVYLYSFGNSSAMVVLHHVAYGDVSPYERVAAGQYSVAMRAAGAAASSAAVLSTSVQISSGHAYTVAGMGPESGLRLAVLDDKLTTPHGRALVRVIQASLKRHVVTVTSGGHPLAHNLAFGAVSSYANVPAGRETVLVTADPAAAADTTLTSRSVLLSAETVHTLVVLDGANGLEVVDLEDAVGNTAVPVGSVATGFGGTAPRGPSSPVPWLMLTAVGTSLALAGALRLRRPRT